MSIMPETVDAQWRPFYEVAKSAEHGRIFTYNEIEELVGFPIISGGRWVVYATDRELQRFDRRALENLRGVGYRIAMPEDHLKLANGRRMRSKRQARRGVQVADATDYALIDDPTARRAIMDMSDHLRSVEARLRYQNLRLERSEKAIEEIRVSSVQTQEDLNTRLSKLEELLSRRSHEGQEETT